MSDQIQAWVHRTANEVLKGRSPHDRARFYEDLVQLGWVSGLQAALSYVEGKGSTLQSWVITSAKRDMVRYLNSEMESGANHEDITNLLDEDDVDELLDYDLQSLLERKADLSNLVDKLPRRESNVVKLYYYHDMSESEIGTHYGISRSMVRKIKDRAVAKIQQLVG